MKLPIAPTCPIHKGVRMAARPEAEPLFTQAGSRWTNKKRITKRQAEAEKREIWRCTVAGCPRVEVVEERGEMR